MRNRLHDLSIRKKFAVVLIPLIITIIVFDYFQIHDNFLDYKDSTRLNKAIIVGIEINHVVHEIQKERSISAGYLSTGANNFYKSLLVQRTRTDSTLNQFRNEITDPHLTDLMRVHGEDIRQLNDYFDRLTSIREQVNERTVVANVTIGYFSEINSVALNTVSNLINETRDKALAQQVHAIIYFLKSKEKASIERAIGTQAFSMTKMPDEMYNEYASLVSAQDSYLDAFLTIANEESRKYHDRMITGPDIREAQRLREILLKNHSLGEDPAHFYNVITAKINLLKKIEDYMSVKIHEYTEALAADANREFWIFLVVDLLIAIVTFTLIANIVSKLVENVRILEGFTKKISSGDLTAKVHIPTKDELGQYARTFNSMVKEINTTHRALEKERDHTQYLYENVIKQSEVVFENVHQGIFLLDEHFKISNLYSRAMEDIFDTKKIAGENFASFMRPHILPRDLEALEMFMKHLFNRDMDEDVVTQLNPVEQVKIFTETDGLVNNKYISVSFTRIERDGIIQNIMVTISDETESILLQKHLEEAEEQKKKETEQILAILKIEPRELSTYLINTNNALKGISVSYEENNNNDFGLLLERTFQVVHKLKGNSMAIGLDLMRDKFHQIEEVLTSLKDKEVQGKDFLPILYEIDEAGKIVANMNRTLEKIAKVYSTLPVQEEKETKDALAASLKMGLHNMSRESNKDANLIFRNERDVLLPEGVNGAVKEILIQLMRNSLAHGIEDLEIRQKSDKTEVGNIIVSIDQDDAKNLIVSYCDDGKGLDYKAIVKKAVDMGVISVEEARQLSDEEINDLIFHQGFSTSREANNMSGRGTGMGLVRSLIHDQGGSYSINSIRGHFFEMTMKFPGTEAQTIERLAS